MKIQNPCRPDKPPNLFNTISMPPLAPVQKNALVGFGNESEGQSQAKSRLLVFTPDEGYWRKLLDASSTADRKLLWKRDTNDTARALRLFKPRAVLLDLDPPSAWTAADLLLQDRNAPPLLLLTSRVDQVDFKTAIESGSLIDKHLDPLKLLTMSEQQASESVRQEQTAAQQLMLRWLKPYSTPRPVLRRFWGINE